MCIFFNVSSHKSLQLLHVFKNFSPSAVPCSSLVTAYCYTTNTVLFDGRFH